MTSDTPIQHRLRARFREVFGEPQHTMGHDDHWRLQPAVGNLAMNILVNGSPEKPAVWIFEAELSDDRVHSRSISSHEHVEEVIVQIQDRLRTSGT